MACADRWKYDPHVFIVKVRYWVDHRGVQIDLHLGEYSTFGDENARRHYNRTTIIQEIEKIKSTINTGPGELYIDIPATNPRYIHVQEGDCIMEGDIRSRRREELESPTLKMEDQFDFGRFRHWS
jgi:hypothetical protein